MNAAVLSGVIVAVIAVLTGVGALLKWLMNRSAEDREMKISLDANTESNAKLDSRLEKVGDKLEEFVKVSTDNWHNLNTRVTVLEFAQGRQSPNHVPE